MHPQYTEKFAQRFWSIVQKSDGCWLWKNRLGVDGYARIYTPMGREYAHRAAYQLINGVIPDGMLVCHRCDVRHCCNPAHLFLGTTADNARDAMNKGRLDLTGLRNRKGQTGYWYPHRIPKGEDVGTAKLTADAVREIRYCYAEGGITHKELAERFGVKRQHICRIVNRQTWMHLP